MKTTTKTTRLASALLLLLLGACTAVPDDEASPSEDELEADALEEERAGGERPTAPSGPVADPERAQIDELRAGLCTQELHPTPPRDLAASTLTRGLVDPRYRVVEDQEQAALAALDRQAVEGRHYPSLEIEAPTLEAQARYLTAAEALAAEGWESPEALAEAKAHEKRQALGDDIEAVEPE